MCYIPKSFLSERTDRLNLNINISIISLAETNKATSVGHTTSQLKHNTKIKEIAERNVSINIGLNISKFTEMLANLNYQMNTPGFYDLYVYLDAKK